MSFKNKKPLAKIQLSWYDDSTLLEEDSFKLVRLFLKSLGINARVPAEILEVLLLFGDEYLTTKRIKEKILELRKKRYGRANRKGLTERNLQKWLKQFIELELIERYRERYRFKNDKSLSYAFEKYTLELLNNAIEYNKKLIAEIEKRYEKW